MSGAKRFPIILTIAVAISLVILLSFGGWQMKRLAWKTDLLARIEALKTAPAIPLDEALRRDRNREPVEWTRVSVECVPLPEYRQGLLYGVSDGQIVWRALAPCGLKSADNIYVALDRGIATGKNGQMTPTEVGFPPPGRVVGILRKIEGVDKVGPDAAASGTPIKGGLLRTKRDAAAFYALDRPLIYTDRSSLRDWYIAVEQETPAVEGLTPAATPADIPNRHLEYALTWYGLAGALVAIYAAMLWRRFKAR
jgi:surfeit locus 1 family protein